MRKGETGGRGGGGGQTSFFSLKCNTVHTKTV